MKLTLWRKGDHVRVYVNGHRFENARIWFGPADPARCQDMPAGQRPTWALRGDGDFGTIPKEAALSEVRKQALLDAGLIGADTPIKNYPTFEEIVASVSAASR
jgi:hypothetical protein